MRLWHQALIHYLPRQQLLGQHRECCALRGKGWGKKHSVVDYVFKYPYAWLFVYHDMIMREMQRRKFKVDYSWFRITYRGKSLPKESDNIFLYGGSTLDYKSPDNSHIYPEHNDIYLKECLDNLEAKGAELVNNESIARMKLMLMLKKGI